MSQHRTPLRYPGGKQKLAPFIIELLFNNDLVDGNYVEPYAGGAGVALELLLGNYVRHVHLNDSSLPIYAFWKSVITYTEDLCRRIFSASLNVEEWKRRREIVQNPTQYDEFEVGFSTLYLNRCNRSGVLSGGLIGGIEQKGSWKMDARFPRNELIQRIEAIASKKDSITLRNWDAEKFILEYIPGLPDRTIVYCDPPYFGQSSRLYLNHYKQDDHARIAKIIQEHLPRKWIISYDAADQILGYYKRRKLFLYSLQYNALEVYKGKEVFIFSDDLSIPTTSTLRYIDEALRNYRPHKNTVRPSHSTRFYPGFSRRPICTARHRHPNASTQRSAHQPRRAENHFGPHHPITNRRRPFIKPSRHYRNQLSRLPYREPR